MEMAGTTSTQSMGSVLGKLGPLEHLLEMLLITCLSIIFNVPIL